ncbi:MAG: hypothetical protein C0598_10040 [Marinilabiliales bacterium]|nr:MAG: hypothetical protein C0598_10040 [Marinilabiliales bacterium]
MKYYITSLFLIIIFIPALFSQTIHVPQDYQTIQTAIDAAIENDTILVDYGSYYENINFKGKNIVVCSNYAISGNQDDISSTIINGSMPQHEDTASCVLIVSGEDSTAVLQGFTITGGTGTKWEDEHGPGNYYTEGGGILIQQSSPTIKNNIITANEAINEEGSILSAGGGGIRCGDGNPHIINNVISYNQGLYGGGIVMNYSDATIKNNIIFGNSGGDDYGGGGLWFLQNGESPIIVENNTIAYNHSKKGGGGLRLWSSDVQMTNNIVWGNTATFSSQIQGSGDLTYCCVEGGFDGDGNIDTDPGFSETSFILTDTSPCIDAGNPDAFYNDPEDPLNPGFALYPANGELINDMGAYGGPGCIELSQIITSRNEEIQRIEDDYIRVFPNPAHNYIILSSNSQTDNYTETELINIRGELIMTFRTQHFNDLKIDITNLENGIYFLKCKNTKKCITKRIIKI